MSRPVRRERPAPAGQRPYARPAKVFRLPLQPIVDEFLEEVEQTLAPATERAYRVPLMLFLSYLRTVLGREPTLDDLALDTVRCWIAELRERPKQLRGGAAEETSDHSALFASRGCQPRMGRHSLKLPVRAPLITKRCENRKTSATGKTMMTPASANSAR